VLVFGAQNARDFEEIAVETEGSEEVSGIVGEAGGFGEGGRRTRRWERLERRRDRGRQ
jgi:hypothetical protein